MVSKKLTVKPTKFLPECTITLSVYRSRFEALPSIGPAIFAEQIVKRSKTPPRMGIYTRVALQTTVICWAATCDEQADGHRAIAHTARE